MADVSRETVPAPDLAIVAQVCPPDRLTLLERYAERLAGDGVVRGLIGPREVPRLWDRHLVNCALLGTLVPERAAVADLGSGAGLPGLVLAIVRPDLRVVLVEPMERRVAFLHEAIQDLGLDTVVVVRERAGQWATDRRFDVVTARALAPLPKLLGWGMPLVSGGGRLLAMKGASASDEVQASAAELRRWSAHAEVVVSTVPGSSPATVVRVVREDGSRIGLRGSKRRGGGREHV